MHKIAPEIEKKISIPILHIADATAEPISGRGFKTVGLLGTKFTMEQDFYRGRPESEYSLKVLIPDEVERDLVHRVIYEELCLGEIKESSRDNFLEIIQNLYNKGAQGVILGCTDMRLYLTQPYSIPSRQ